MKCPYNRRVETTIQNWGQDSDDNQTPTKGTTVTQTVMSLWSVKKKTVVHGKTEDAVMQL